MSGGCMIRPDRQARAEPDAPNSPDPVRESFRLQHCRRWAGMRSHALVAQFPFPLRPTRTNGPRSVPASRKQEQHDAGFRRDTRESRHRVGVAGPASWPPCGRSDADRHCDLACADNSSRTRAPPLDHETLKTMRKGGASVQRFARQTAHRRSAMTRHLSSASSWRGSTASRVKPRRGARAAEASTGKPA